MNHLQSNKAIFEAYRAPAEHTVIKENNDGDTKYVTVSTIQKNLKIALEDMLKTFHNLTRSASRTVSLRQVQAINEELRNGDASLVVPYLKMALTRPTLVEAKDLVINNSHLVLPDDVIKWAESVAGGVDNETVVIRDDLASERSVVTISVNSLDL